MKMSDGASSFRAEINELKYRFDKFSNYDSLATISRARSQLHSARIKQKDLDYLLEKSESAKKESKRASELARRVFDNASDILNNLNNFDNLVQLGQSRLAEAEQKISLIDENDRIVQSLLEDFALKMSDLSFSIQSAKETSIKSSSKIGDFLKVSC